MGMLGVGKGLRSWEKTCLGHGFKATDCHSWCLCLAWLEDKASKTCQPLLLIFSPSLLQEILSSWRDREVLSGAVGATYRLGFTSQHSSLPTHLPSLASETGVVTAPGLGPLTLDTKGSREPASARPLSQGEKETQKPSLKGS